jgi:hypothetical protein
VSGFPNPVQQTWTVSGWTLSLRDTGGSGCAGGVVGQYTLAFTYLCNTMTMTSISDVCTERGGCVNGLVVTRN